jgi:hypothetical protein
VAFFCYSACRQAICLSASSQFLRYVEHDKMAEKEHIRAEEARSETPASGNISSSNGKSLCLRKLGIDPDSK